LPPGLIFLLEKYQYCIAEMRKKGVIQSKEIKKEWDEVISISESKSYTIGSYLLSTTWDQGDLDTTRMDYNYYCPNHYPAGCGAVAMAQILRYWACRVEGTLNTYQWANMNNFTPNIYNARLIRDCGIANQTDYGEDGSSSTIGNALDGLVDYFGINSSAEIKARLWHLSTWEGMLIDEINAGRPLYYRGQTLVGSGHAWVIDGYDNDEKFHCNWGWGSFNGFYYLGDFPVGSPVFNQIERAIFYIEPVRDNGVDVPQLTAQTFFYNSNGYLLSVPETWGATSYEWATSSGTITPSGNSRYATLYTTTSANVSVSAYNDLCEIYSSYDTVTITIRYGSISGPTQVCSSTTATYSVNNMPQGATIVWSSGTGLTRTSAQGANPCNFSVSGSGTSYVSAVITFSGNTFTTPNYTVNRVDYPVPSTPTINVVGASGSGGNYTVALNSSPVYFTLYGGGGYSYGWDTWGISSSYEITGNALDLYPDVADYNMISGYVYNTCHQSQRVTAYLEVTEYRLLVSPNPASEYVEIELLSTEETLTDDDLRIDFVNANSNIIKQEMLSGTKNRVNIQDLPKGLYIVTLHHGKKAYSTKLMIE
jgi:hypothetical protein